MNWVDLTVLGVLAVSALLAFARGFVREALGIGAWLGAAAFAVFWTAPVEKQFEQWINNPDLARPAAYAATFLVALLVLSVIAGMVGSMVRNSALSAVDRTLGMAFGLARGALLVIAAYIGAGFLMPAANWPEPVRNARLLPLAAQGATWLTDVVPQQYRPSLPDFTPPPIDAAKLMQALPRKS